MNYNETIKEMQDTFVLDQQNATESYKSIEKNLSEHTCQFILNKEVSSLAYGKGTIKEATGETFDTIILDVAFTTITKRFALHPIITNTKFIKFVDEELYESLTTALTLHSNLTTALNEFKLAARQAKIEAEKKAEAEQKAEARYLEQKEKALRDFDSLVQAHDIVNISREDDFYYALGWLANHVGTISANLPDYLEAAFTKYFGVDTPCHVIDSKKRGPAGWQSQWSWSFRASIKKSAEAPAILSQYLNPAGNAITNTSFIWDLVDNYGFQFSKKQDIEKIVQAIPVRYLDSFKAGLAA